MSLSAGDKIRIILKRRGMTVGELAERTGQTRQNLSNKLSRNNFQEKELQEIAVALGCSYSLTFTLEDTGEQI